MDNLDIYKFRVGAFVLIALLILCILFVATNVDENPFQARYQVVVKPISAPGVMAGTPVRRNGVLIGRVKAVKAEDDFVVLKMDINEDDKIYANETVSIGAAGFLGDSAVEILPKSKALRGEAVGDGDTMEFVAIKLNPIDVALNLETEISDTLLAVREAGKAVGDAGDGIRELATTVETALQDEQGNFRQMLTEFRTMAQRAQVAIDNFNRIFNNINEFIDDPKMKTEFKRSIAMLPDIFEEVQVTISDTRETINTFRKVSEGAGKNLDNLETFTMALKDNGPEILSQVNASLKNVDGLIGQINSCLLYTSPSPRDLSTSRMPSSA